jgi:uncharacterized protein (TIGR03437 family)
VYAAALLLAATARPAELALTSETAPAGASLIVPVVFQPGADTVTGFQFDLEYDAAAMSLTAVAGDALRVAEKNLYFAPVSDNKLRFLAAGLNQTPIPPGTVIHFFAHVAAAASDGVYAVRFSNVVLTTGAGEPVDASSIDGAITLQGTGGTPLQAGGVLNAASLLPGPVAPGEIVTLFGSAIGPPEPTGGPEDLTTLSLRFNGIPAPVLYAGPNQINAVVPFGVAEQAQAQVSLLRAGQPVAELSLPVADAVPGIFTVGFGGLGPAAILNPDASVNSPDNPAERGTVIAVFATGAGQTSPPSPDGQVPQEPLPQVALPVSVLIGGVPAEVLYAGAAPGFVSGLLQINCRIPAEVEPGYAVPVQLRAGEASSPSGVSIAVR